MYIKRTIKVGPYKYRLNSHSRADSSLSNSCF